MTREKVFELDSIIGSDVIDHIFDYFEAKVKKLEEAVKVHIKINISLVEDVIALEAPKTCDGCVHKPIQGENYYDPCEQCKQFYGDYYEAKK